jgi:hypothetical protein
MAAYNQSYTGLAQHKGKNRVQKKPKAVVYASFLKVQRSLPEGQIVEKRDIWVVLDLSK